MPEADEIGLAAARLDRFSMIPPMASCPISMPPIGPGVESVSIRAVIIARRVVGWAIEYRQRYRDWQADEHSSFRWSLSQQHGADHESSNQEKFSHLDDL